MTAGAFETSAPGCVRRGPGRPRNVEADRAIVAATLEVFDEEGYYGLSIEAVAARAGVGKATVYRRWPSKHELISDALSSLNDGVPDSPPASLPTRQRVELMMEHAGRKDPKSLPGRIFPRMLAYRASHPELFQLYLERVVEPRRERVRQVLREGIERGEVRPDIDVHLATAALIGPVMMLAVSQPADKTLPPGAVRKLADLVWPGIAAP